MIHLICFYILNSVWRSSWVWQTNGRTNRQTDRTAFSNTKL